MFYDDVSGDTALHIASRSGNKAVLLLLKFHAKVGSLIG